MEAVTGFRGGLHGRAVHASGTIPALPHYRQCDIPGRDQQMRNFRARLRRSVAAISRVPMNKESRPRLISVFDAPCGNERDNWRATLLRLPLVLSTVACQEWMQFQTRQTQRAAFSRIKWSRCADRR